MPFCSWWVFSKIIVIYICYKNALPLQVVFSGHPVEHWPHHSCVWLVDPGPSVFSWLVMEAHWNKVALHRSSQESWSLGTRYQPVTREGSKKKVNILQGNKALKHVNYS